MGARPSTFKKGGGLLNNVDATITDYEFLVGDTVQIKKGSRKGEDFTPLSLAVSLRVDGADEDTVQRLLIGDAPNFGDVTNDGKTLQTPDGQAFSQNCEAAIFLASLCNPEEGEGFPEDRLSDSDTDINVEPIIGTRVRLVRPTQESRTGKANKQKGKDGKDYDRRELKVQQVYDLPSVKAVKTTLKAVKSSGKAVATSDPSELATTTIVAILKKEKGNKIEKAKLGMKVLTTLVNDPNCESVRKLARNDEFLKGQDEWAYDEDTEVLELAS